MPRTRPPYPEEYRQQILTLIGAGRTAEELAKEFEPSAQTIRSWIVQDQLDRGEREDGVTSDEKAELARLRRENKRLRQEREILKKPRPSSHRRRVPCLPNLPVHESG